MTPLSEVIYLGAPKLLRKRFGISVYKRLEQSGILSEYVYLLIQHVIKTVHDLYGFF